jgi:hypothetical protein
MTKLGEDIVVVIGGEAVRLVPRLRHALALERRPGSFRGILEEIEQGSLTASAEIIRLHRPDISLDTIFAAGLDRLKPALFAFVIGCTGVDTDEASRAPRATRARARETQSFGDHLAGLYRWGTGWLGWTPDQTLAATPAEITEAYRGRVEMLRAIFGGTDEDEKPKDDRDFGEKFAAFARARNHSGARS